jgi:hypothetical protein
MRTSKIKGKIYVYDPASGKMVEKKRPEVIEMLPMPPREPTELAEEELECPVPSMAERLENDPLLNPKLYICECGAVCDPVNSEWRCAGNYWEHYHGYPIGHVAVFVQSGR